MTKVVKRIDDTTGEPECWEIDGHVWIERGLGIHRDVIATPELLAKLHPDYSTPHATFFKNHPVHGAKYDGAALGQNGEPIVMGKPMSYITYPVAGVDHGWPNNGKVWFVFTLEDDANRPYYKTFDQIAKLEDGTSVSVTTKPPEIDPTHPMHNKIWVERGQFVELAEAEALADTFSTK